MSGFPGRETAFVGAVFSGPLAVVSAVGRFQGRVLPGREWLADLMVPAGGTLLVYCVFRLRRLKAAESPQSWGWFLRRELGFSAGLGVLVTLGLLFPETAEAVTEGLREFLDGVQVLKAGRG